MKLYAISDLHLNYLENQAALLDMEHHPEDWLILAGDIGETEEHLHMAFSVLKDRFQRLIWVPGNHDLWSRPEDREKEGQAKYEALVELCHSYGVTTPEDDYILWEGEGPKCFLVPLFLLYDYSFRPPDVPLEGALLWARESGLVCTDEVFLRCTPYLNIVQWFEARYKYSVERISKLSREVPILFINHFPMTEKPLARLRRIPRFTIWCGSKKTADWHKCFPTLAVVYGHLHIRATDYEDGVRFEEVSLGYPKHWDPTQGINAYVREILPGPDADVLEKPQFF